jgi:hypothetical protein
MTKKQAFDKFYGEIKDKNKNLASSFQLNEKVSWETCTGFVSGIVIGFGLLDEDLDLWNDGYG